MAKVESVIYKEPKKEFAVRFSLIPVSQIFIPTIQRNLSESLIKKLSISIEKVGFITPIIVVEKEQGVYEVIDGQHRLEAGKLLGYSEIPAFIVPKEIEDFILTLNTEKPSNLKDKAHQVYEIYMKYLNENPDMEEVELEMMVEAPYYITVGFVIERFEERRFSGYAWESVLKKIDGFIDATLKDAEKIREERAKLLLEANNVLTEKFQELGLSNSLLKKEIVSKSWQNVYGKRVRLIEDDYETALRKVMEEIKKFKFEDVEQIPEEFSHF